MFTGLIEGIGTVRSITRRSLTAIYEFECDFDLGDTNVGDSIAISGCCLTVTSRLGSHFWADISDETLRVTNLGGLKEGDAVNLERALRLGERLGGHIVQGHVDGVGKVRSVRDVEAGREMEIQVPEKLIRYIVEKGSIAVDGISLTVNNIRGDIASVRIIPHTIGKTALKGSSVGDAVNLEVDIIGKYVEKLCLPRSEDNGGEGKVTEEFLRRHGF